MLRIPILLYELEITIEVCYIAFVDQNNIYL